MWNVESIPNEDSLFYRIHEQHIRRLKLKTKAFQEFGDGEDKGMSTDWEKYSNPQETRDRARNPEKNGVVSLVVGFLREVHLAVKHAPTENHPNPEIKDNRAHTNVTGIDGMDVEVRLKLSEHIKWEIEPPVEVDKSDCRV